MKKLTKIFAALAVLAVLAGCSAKAAAPELKPAVVVEYDTAKVLRGDCASVNMYDAYVKAVTEGAAFSASGTLGEVLVRPGDRVEQGDVLLRLNTAALTRSAVSVEERLEKLKSQYEYDRGQCQCDLESARLKSGSAQEIAAEKLEVRLQYLDDTYALESEELEAELKKTRQAIEDASLRAPCSGEVVYVTPTSVGGRVSAYSELVQIATEELYIQYDGSENLSRTTARVCFTEGGQERELSLIGYTNKEYLSIVLSGKNPPARFAIPAGVAGLQAGDYVLLTAYSAEYNDCLYIPSNSLYTTGQNTGYVYRIVDGVTVYTDVTFEAKTKLWAVLGSGIQEGDVVLVRQ